MNTDKIYAEKLASEYAPKETSKVMQLKKLDRKAKRTANIFGYTFGIVMTLVLGIGMCLCMKVIGSGTTTSMVLGIAIGLVGIAGVTINVPIYNKLLSETLEYLNSKFHSYFSETAEEVVSGIPDAPLCNLVFTREKYLVPYLNYIRENRKVFALSYRQRQTMQSYERFDSLYRFIINPIMERFHVDENLREYYNAFFMQGILAVIQEWLKNGCKE